MFAQAAITKHQAHVLVRVRSAAVHFGAPRRIARASVAGRVCL